MGVNSLARDTLNSTVKYTSALAGNDTADVALSSDFLIQEVVLNGTTTSIALDVSTLAAQGYKHLQIRTVLRSATGSSSTSNWISMRFNGDTGNNYSSHWLYGYGIGYGTGADTSATSMLFSHVAGSSTTANTFTVAITDILDFGSTSKNKTISSLFGFRANNASNAGEIGLLSGNWRNTSAVNSITIFSSESFASGSRVSIYGSKG